MKPSNVAAISSFRPLHALKSIIHPPLPLTGRQSTQLLSLLKTSFRNQLELASSSSAQPASDTGNAAEPKRLPVDAHLSELLNAPVFLDSYRAAKATSGEADQVGVERFLREPLQVYHELATQGVPSPDVAWAVLKRHTTNILSLPKTTKAEDGWAVKAVLRVIKPLWNISPRAHLEDKRLRQQIIQTLVQGDEAEIAAGMLNKPWLLHISPEQPDAQFLLELRQSIIDEVTKITEQVQGLNNAASLFLQMLQSWQTSVEKLSDRSGRYKNPFLITGQYLLLRYAHCRDPANSLLRTIIYKNCTPWIRSKFARAKLMLYYEDNPYSLYGIVMHRANPGKQPGLSTACVELILSLVQHQELIRARKVAFFMRTKLIGKVPELEPAMVDEIEALLLSPEKDILERLAAMVTEGTRKFTDGELIILPAFLKSKEKLMLA